MSIVVGLKAVVTALGGVRATTFFSLFLIASVWSATQTIRLQSCQREALVGQLALEVSARKHAEWMLGEERRTSAAIAAIDKKHRERRDASDENYQLTIADLRANNLKLRQRFTCTQDPSAATSASGVSDGQTQGGLLRTDEEFLISESRRADKITEQLDEAQDIIEEYLRQSSPP